jgi:hypothetical protein
MASYVLALYYECLWMFIVGRYKRYAEERVTFHCPACGQRDVVGIAWSERESFWLLGIVPYAFLTNHWVQGPCCHTRVLAKAWPAVLAATAPDEIEQRGLLQKNLSLITMLSTGIAFLFCVVPILGFVLSMIAFAINRKESLIIRAINIFSMLLNGAFSIFQLYLYLTDKMD